VAPCGGECSGNYCHGSSVMSCGWGLVFNPTGLYCNTPALEGCDVAIAYATVRDAGVSSATHASRTQSQPLVAALTVAVAVLAACVVALVVVHLRARKAAPAGDAQLSEVAVDGVSMRRGFAHQTLPEEKEEQKKEPVDV